MRNIKDTIDFLKKESDAITEALSDYYKEGQLTFSVGKILQGYANIHVTLDGITYGKIVFKNKELFNIKYYKLPIIIFNKDDPGEILFLLLYCYYTYKAIPSPETLDLIIAEAESIRENDIKKKEEWRIANPKSGRPPIEGKSVRYCIYMLLPKYITKKN